MVFTVGLLQMEALLGSGTKETLRDIEKGAFLFQECPCGSACLSVSACMFLNFLPSSCSAWQVEAWDQTSEFYTSSAL